MVISYIEEKAEKILLEANLLQAPIKIKKLIKSYGIELEAIEMDDSVSGLISIDNDTTKIGYNSGHAENRVRFTIAHEFGHYTLHSKSSKLFINQSNRILYREFRDADSSSGEMLKEREANAFAAAILMPATLIEQEIENSLVKGKALIRQLANKFKVSEQAMSIRLSKLGFMDYDYFAE